MKCKVAVLMLLLATLVVLEGCESGTTPVATDPKTTAQCFIQMSWALPTEYEDNTPLAAVDITSMTLFLMDANQQIITRTVNPHTLLWQEFGLDGTWDTHATVSVGDITSADSNMVTRICSTGEVL